MATNGLLTTKEAAALLGVSVDSVYAMRAAGKLDGVPGGNRVWRFREADIRAMVDGTPAAVALTDAQLDAVAARVLTRLLAAVQPAAADELAPRRKRA